MLSSTANAGSTANTAASQADLAQLLAYNTSASLNTVQNMTFDRVTGGAPTRAYLLLHEK